MPIWRNLCALNTHDLSIDVRSTRTLFFYINAVSHRGQILLSLGLYNVKTKKKNLKPKTWHLCAFDIRNNTVAVAFFKNCSSSHALRRAVDVASGDPDGPNPNRRVTDEDVQQRHHLSKLEPRRRPTRIPLAFPHLNFE